MLDNFIIQDIVRCLYTIEFVKVISYWSLTYIYMVQNRWHTVEHGFDLPCKPIDTKKKITKPSDGSVLPDLAFASASRTTTVSSG